MPEEKTDRIPHDQAFKQLLAEFPEEALPFFAGEEGRRLPPGWKITLLRQEQLSKELGKGHREIDVALLLEWPDGRAEALAFLLEEEAKPSRDAAFKVAEYLLLLGRWLEKDRRLARIVPALVFVGDGKADTTIEIGTDLRTYLRFECVTCRLSGMDAEEAIQSGNLAAAANVMNMKYPAEEKVALCTAAIALWYRKTGREDAVAKFGGYIQRCARLNSKERVELKERLSAAEGGAMQTIFDDFREEGRAEGEAKGRAEGEAKGRADAILDLLAARDVPVDDNDRQRIRDCPDIDQLRRMLVRATTARSVAEVLSDN